MELTKLLGHIKDERVGRAIRIEAHIMNIMREYLSSKGFVEILPVMVSRITDPLTTVKNSLEVHIDGADLKLTKSMIFHKQMALFAFDRIFVFSPNIRLEDHRTENTGRHLIEFVQLDVEIKNARREEIMNLVEELLAHIVDRLKECCYEELEYFGRTELNLVRPFKRITYEEAIELHGGDYEKAVSLESETPVWITDFPEELREFYYKSDPETGYMYDFDLIYPGGYGEAVSGGEREDKIESVHKKLKGKSKDDILEFYTKLLEAGLPPSCGFGIGIERLTRFICGLEHVKFARLFPKLPGLHEFTI